jgi:hypothetical protein
MSAAPEKSRETAAAHDDAASKTQTTTFIFIFSLA